jgi:organic hydroperoxide reductase OsmC/OhrA
VRPLGLSVSDCGSGWKRTTITSLRIIGQLTVVLSDIDQAFAKDIVDAVCQVYPYLDATRGNIGVDITVV